RRDCPDSEGHSLSREGRLDASARELSKISPATDNEGAKLAGYLQLTYERRFDAIINRMEQDIASGQSIDPRCLVLLGDSQRRVGKTDDSRATLERTIVVMKPAPDTAVAVDARDLPCFLAWAYAGLGEKEKALTQADHAVSDYKDDVLSKPFAEMTRATIQAEFGDFDSALAALPHLLTVPNGITPAILRLDPLWDPLRQDPRFQKLIAEPG